MVNELQSQEWAYLLDPCFQLVNTNGKPLTNGHIEVFYHGTRTPYYCASDWNGTLHPFKIKIDSLGSNVVLADPKFSYDVYVYNAYGVLQMSRYNVNPGVGGSGGSSISDGEAPHWNSDPNGGASSSVTGGTTVYLTLPSSEDQPEFVDHATDTAIFLKGGLYHIDAVVSFKQDDEDLQNLIKDLVVNTGLIGWDAQMTGQKNWTGPESTDDDRHFLELHTVVSVPEDLLQPLYFQISSPVDLDSAAIEKLDIVKLTAGGGGMTYAAGYGIDITGQVISTSGMMPESSAANFVDVSTYNTDIENIYETIAETSAMIPSGVATQDWVTDYTSAFITSADLPDLSDYATQQWVEDQHYITSADIPDIPEDVVTSGELATVSGDIVSQIPSLDGYATQNWVEDQHYITSADIPDIPEDVVTSGELASTSAALESMIPSLDGYTTEEDVVNYVAEATSAFITSADVPQFTQEQADWDEDDPTAPDYIKNKPSIPSIEGLASEEYVQDYTSAFITSADIPDVPADVVTSGQLATVSGEIVNQIPDVSDMATQTWVGEQGYLTSIPEDLVSSGELATVSSDLKTWVGQQGYISQIYTDSTITGDGTQADPFSVASADIWNEAAGLNEYPISAGPGMSIEDVSGVTVFSCTGGSTGIPSQLYNSIDDPQPAIALSTFSAYSPETSAVFYNAPHFTVQNPSSPILEIASNGYSKTTIEPTKFFSTYNGVSGPSTQISPAYEHLYCSPSGEVTLDAMNGYISSKENGTGKPFDSRKAIQTSDLTIVDNEITEISGYSIAGSDDGLPSQLYHNALDDSPAIFITSYQDSAYNESTSANLENGIHLKIDGTTIETSFGSNSPKTRITPQDFWSSFGPNAPETSIRPGTISVYYGTSGRVDAYYDGHIEAKEQATGKTFDSRNALQSSDLTIVNNEITEISGYSIAGDELPDDIVTSGQLATVSGNIMNEIPDLTGYATETWVSNGFMETSGLEFNSQDEISGYNGHPVMTVDSEKQWLTHDDTIAHVTNSAQYAFGVNVPVVAQAMGTDETVLYTGTSSSSPIVLSEVITNFDRVRITWQHNLNNTIINNTVFEYQIPSNEFLGYGGRTGGGGFAWFIAAWTIGTDNKTLTRTESKYVPINSTVGTPANSDNLFPIKVVGIGRKENT